MSEVSKTSSHLQLAGTNSGAKGMGVIVQRSALVLLEIITATIGPERRETLVKVAAVAFLPEDSGLGVTTVGKDSEGPGFDHILVPAGVVPHVDLLGIACAVLAAKCADFPGERPRAEGEEGESLEYMHCWLLWKNR